MDVTLDKFGRIVIPKSIRDWLGLHAGSELQIDVAEHEDGGRTVTLRVPGDRPGLLEEDGLLVHTGTLQVSDFDLVEQLRGERSDRARQIARR